MRSSNQTRRLYDRHGFGDFSYGRTRDNYNRPLIEYVQTIEPGSTVLDVGCGTGYWMEGVERCGARPGRVVGIDVSINSVRTATSKGFQCLAGDVCALPVADNVSDVTICNGVIHHTAHPFLAFSELVRVTRPGGRIFLCVYCRWNPYFYLVHRAAWPVRWAYWNWSERTLDVLWPVVGPALAAAGRVLARQPVDGQTARALLMDQVITPYAHLFSRARLSRYAARCGCELTACRLTRAALMWSAVFRVAEVSGKNETARSL